MINNTNNDDNNVEYIEQQVDLDKINLLIDTLKYRVGANGR